MRTVIAAACRFAEQAAPSATVFALWQAIYAQQSIWASSQGYPPLVWSFGVSLVDRALIDGWCRSTNTPFHQAVRTNALGIRLDAIHPDLGDRQPAEFLPAAPLRSLIVCHTVGLSDPIDDGDIAPQSLAANITTYGLTHFKIKLSGNDDQDLARLCALAALIERLCPSFAFTLDGEETQQWVSVSNNNLCTDVAGRGDDGFVLCRMQGNTALPPFCFCVKFRIAGNQHPIGPRFWRGGMQLLDHRIHHGFEFSDRAEGGNVNGHGPRHVFTAGQLSTKATPGEHPGQNIDHDSQAIPFMAALLQTVAQRGLGPSFAALGGWFGDGDALRVYGPACRNRHTQPPGQAQLAAGYGGRGHIEQKRAFLAGRRAKSDGIRAQSRMCAMQGTHRAGGVRHRHADHILRYGHQRIVPDHANVMSIAHGGHAHTMLLRLCNREFHGAVRSHKAQTVATIQQCGRLRLGNDFNRLGNGVHTILDGLYIARHVADAVGVHTAQAGCCQNLRGDLCMTVWYVDRLQDCHYLAPNRVRSDPDCVLLWNIQEFEDHVDLLCIDS
jgi:hypothetical protein